jgi:hypothetical protein
VGGLDGALRPREVAAHEDVDATLREGLHDVPR